MIVNTLATKKSTTNSNNSKKSWTVKELQNEPLATADGAKFKDHTDPKYIGPGTWNTIHRLAFEARTPELQKQFAAEVNLICEGFPCEVCRGHCKEYIKNHPVNDYFGVIIEINNEKILLGMFIWSWKFHNSVNSRIKKPIMSWDTAYALYSIKESMICTQACMETSDKGFKGEIPKETPKENVTKNPQKKLIKSEKNLSVNLEIPKTLPIQPIATDRAPFRMINIR